MFLFQIKEQMRASNAGSEIHLSPTGLASPLPTRTHQAELEQFVNKLSQLVEPANRRSVVSQGKDTDLFAPIVLTQLALARS